MARLKRRTQKERLGERKLYKRSNWLRLFSREEKEAKILARVQARIQEKMLEEPESQAIGRLREKKVFDALQSLKEKGEIHDYLWSERLSYANLIEGVDFIFIYIDDCYEVCRFSVTGWRWIDRHQKRHPEIPVFPVDLTESRESIEQKILILRNGKGKCP